MLFPFLVSAASSLFFCVQHISELICVFFLRADEIAQQTDNDRRISRILMQELYVHVSTIIQPHRQ